MINIKSINLDLNNSIRRYINNRLDTIIKKFTNNKPTTCDVFLEKTTNHHNKGDLYKAEIKMNIDGKNFVVLSQKEDLYKAIDDVKEQLVRRITDTKEKKKTLFKRGATSVKKMIKGISKRNPFTSKY